MAGTRIVGIIGKKNCGKTTLVVALAREFARQGKTVGTLKHGSHPATVDQEGTDTWRHFHEGNAAKVMIDAPGARVYFERTEIDGNPLQLTSHYMHGMDIVIAEGFTAHPIPRIEVFRANQHKKPHYSPDHPHADKWVALLTDDRLKDIPCPQFRFSDTAWLVTLSGLAWNAAIDVPTP